ncbi:AraC family transcriptional regulator [Paenibacillus cremeus]|nr:AraC family transcriptional regulator [Paenibacillus cremeus]
MKRPQQTLTAERVFGSSFHIYVNRAVEDFDLPLHSHDFIEFAYVAEGKGFHHMENQVETAKKGQLFIIPLGISHVFRPSSADAQKNPLVVYNCVFTPQALDQVAVLIDDPHITEQVNRLKGASLSPSSIMDATGAMEPLFVKLHQEYALTRTGSHTYLYALLLQLIVEAYRLQHELPTLSVSSEGAAHFSHVLHYVDRHYGDDLTLSDLAERCQWSERHLQRLFKQHTGQTFRSYLQNVRIHHSCHALRTTQHKISSIAISVGYKDIDSFIGVFKRIVGVSPQTYRRQFLI